jgi:hypothetical protein
MNFITYLFFKLMRPVVTPPNLAKGIMEPGYRVYVLFNVNSNVHVLQFGPPYSAVPTPNEYFWREKSTNATYGPFKTLYETMTHYTWTVSLRGGGVKSGKIIYVDFKTKKRAEL